MSHEMLGDEYRLLRVTKIGCEEGGAQSGTRGENESSLLEWRIKRE
jgi:hypothetical protein